MRGINKYKINICPLLTWEVVERSGNIFSWVAVRCVADHQAGLAHRSVSEQDALQQPLLRLAWPGGFGIVWGHRRGHGPSVIHGDWRWHSIGQHFTAVSSTGSWRKDPPWEHRLLVLLVQRLINASRGGPCVKRLLLPCALPNPTVARYYERSRLGACSLQRVGGSKALCPRIDLPDPTHSTSLQRRAERTQVDERRENVSSVSKFKDFFLLAFLWSWNTIDEPFQ